MAGFFSDTPLRSNVHSESTQGFANAIQERYNASDHRLLTTRLAPIQKERPYSSRPPPPPQMSTPSFSSPGSIPGPSRITSTSSAPVSQDNFTAVFANALPQALQSSDILILDIRPHSAYMASRLPHAISLSVPSTLLKRPTFNLQKLATMLPSTSSKIRFDSWPTTSRILVYDSESTSLQQSSNLFGVLRKFRVEGFTGDLLWLHGGLQSLLRSHRYLVNENPPSDDEDDVEDSRFVCARNIPMAAFQSSTTMTVAPRASPTDGPRSSHSSNGLSQRTSTMSSPRRSAPPPRLDQSVMAAANPFYDNIRQNRELSEGITERIPLLLSPDVIARVREIPFPWLRGVAECAGREANTVALAEQFFRIEQHEQKRLHGVMAYHSKQSGKRDEAATTTFFPYSITAGIEKGGKNRYRNIWPFEHARVRLNSSRDDYVNASYVQPIGTRKRYIATQGPLPSTFTDFWTLVWEQNVRVVVMLTKQYEGLEMKCGKYWSEDGYYGPFRLRLLSQSGAKPEVEPSPTTNGFNLAPSTTIKASDEDDDPENNHTVRRMFELTNTAEPKQPPHFITHIQYLGWPDMNVPNNPRGILRLMREVDAVMDQTNDEVNMACPALLHCSAGVGRTGAFIAIDAILDGFRRELRHRFSTSTSSSSEPSSERSSDSEKVAMDIDPRTVRPTLPIRSSLSTSAAHSGNSSSTGLGSGKAFLTREVLQTRSGMVATLPMDSSGSSRGRGHDIHVPLVPSSSAPLSSKKKNIAPEFTAADADLMFTESSNPAFAMDVEQYSTTQRSTNGSSSGEGGSRHDSVLPIAAALARLSSSDDVPGRSGRSDWAPSRKHLSRGSGSGSGNASGSGEAGGGSGSGGGYSSSSSQVLSAHSSSSRVTFALVKSGSSSPHPRPNHHPSVNPLEAGPRSIPVPFPYNRGPPSSSSGSSMKDRHVNKHHRSSSSSALSTDARSPIMSPVPYESSETALSRSMTPPNKQSSEDKEAMDGMLSNLNLPRKLHSKEPPRLLSTLDEPIRQILEDMREQRMSLCQTLRQYVFVHSAIIEGSLVVLDEEVDRAMKAGILCSGKRGASPTELPKEGKKGEVVLSKRPSLKRGKSTSSGDSGGSSPVEA